MLLNVQSLCSPINFKQFQHNIHKFDVLRSEYIIERTFKKKTTTPNLWAYDAERDYNFMRPT